MTQTQHDAQSGGSPATPEEQHNEEPAANVEHGDNAMDDGNAQEGQEDALPPPPKLKRESKMQEALDAIYNPERWENDRSLWQFWQNELKKFPTVDDMAREREAKGMKVDMEVLHYEWFDALVSLYRRYLQCAFGESLEIPVFGRRLQKYQETNYNVTHWRYAWIRRYKEEQEIELQQRQAQEKTGNATAADLRAAALARRKAKMAAQATPPEMTLIREEITTSASGMNLDENADFEEVVSSTGKVQPDQNGTEVTMTESELRRLEALARRDKKRRAMKM